MQKRGAYYNEIDPYCVQWLRNLIKAGHIAPGDVDERDIRDVRPNDLRGYAQCHFFAGIGVWSYALRRAGWADDREAWSGSCPCQPFSMAGLGGGFDDERHLWPFFQHLIRVGKPAVVLGEQVASKDADPWIDLVQTDMEALGYAFGAVPFPAAGVGAPHIRDRLYWVADTDEDQRGRRSNNGALLGNRKAPGRLEIASDAQWDRLAGGLADANGRHPGTEREQRGGKQRQLAQDGGVVRVADANGSRSEAGIPTAGHRQEGDAGIADDCRHQFGGGERAFATAHPGPINGYWRDADWLGCRDGKWRPVEPGTFPLAHGAAARVGRLRAYGNAINLWQAVAFIESVMECTP